MLFIFLFDEKKNNTYVHLMSIYILIFFCLLFLKDSFK